MRNTMNSKALEQPTKRGKRSDEDLKAASKHLSYEIQMLYGTANLLAQGNIYSWAVHNALLESFLIHVRIMLEFLYAQKPWPDDVIAEDFFDDPNEWVQARPKKSDLLKDAHKRAGKQLAHLSYTRLAITPEKKAWRFMKIAKQVDQVFKKFLKIVPANRLDGSLRKEDTYYYSSRALISGVELSSTSSTGSSIGNGGIIRDVHNTSLTQDDE